MDNEKDLVEQIKELGKYEFVLLSVSDKDQIKLAHTRGKQELVLTCLMQTILMEISHLVEIPDVNVESVLETLRAYLDEVEKEKRNTVKYLS